MISVAYGNIPAPGLGKVECASQESLRIVCGCFAESFAAQASVMQFDHGGRIVEEMFNRGLFYRRRFVVSSFPRWSFHPGFVVRCFVLVPFGCMRPMDHEAAW